MGNAIEQPAGGATESQLPRRATCATAVPNQPRIAPHPPQTIPNFSTLQQPPPSHSPPPHSHLSASPLTLHYSPPSPLSQPNLPPPLPFIPPHPTLPSSPVPRPTSPFKPGFYPPFNPATTTPFHPPAPFRAHLLPSPPSPLPASPAPGASPRAARRLIASRISSYFAPSFLPLTGSDGSV